MKFIYALMMIAGFALISISLPASAGISGAHNQNQSIDDMSRVSKKDKQ